MNFPDSHWKTIIVFIKNKSFSDKELQETKDFIMKCASKINRKVEKIEVRDREYSFAGVLCV
jgi:hypothetical protein